MLTESYLWHSIFHQTSLRYVAAFSHSPLIYLLWMISTGVFTYFPHRGWGAGGSSMIPRKAKMRFPSRRDGQHVHTGQLNNEKRKARPGQFKNHQDKFFQWEKIDWPLSRSANTHKGLWSLIIDKHLESKERKWFFKKGKWINIC